VQFYGYVQYLMSLSFIATYSSKISLFPFPKKKKKQNTSTQTKYSTFEHSLCKIDFPVCTILQQFRFFSLKRLVHEQFKCCSWKDNQRNKHTKVSYLMFSSLFKEQFRHTFFSFLFSSWDPFSPFSHIPIITNSNEPEYSLYPSFDFPLQPLPYMWDKSRNSFSES